MGVFSALRKNWKLLRIMRRLGRPQSTSALLASAMKGEGPAPDKQVAREDLFRLISDDGELQSIVQSHGATMEEVREIFQQLVLSGAGQWAGGAYVAAAAVATNPTLDYLLTARQQSLPAGWSEHDRWLRISTDLIEYFGSGSMGPVPRLA